jgi:hypothetical protein
MGTDSPAFDCISEWTNQYGAAGDDPEAHIADLGWYASQRGVSEEKQYGELMSSAK